MLAETGYAWPMRDPLMELATVPATPLHPAIAVARGPLARIAVDLLAIPDARLDGPWRWRRSDLDDIERRYAFYRIYERFEAAIGAIESGRATDPGIDDVPSVGGLAVPALAAATAARWDLHGAMAGMPDDAWDADPGGGEWTIRTTIGHIIASQRAYGWYNAWYLSQAARIGEAVYPPDGTLPTDPADDAEGRGTLGEVRRRLDDVVDTNIEASAALGPAAMGVGARWSGLPVSIEFRLGRYGSHIREHTVQIDKTVALIGRQPTEVERLVRLILATYGRLEALLIGRPASDLERPLAGGSSAVIHLTAAVAEAGATATSAAATR
jgi:hypothetical protein